MNGNRPPQYLKVQKRYTASRQAASFTFLAGSGWTGRQWEWLWNTIRVPIDGRVSVTCLMLSTMWRSLLHAVRPMQYIGGEFYRQPFPPGKRFCPVGTKAPGLLQIPT